MGSTCRSSGTRWAARRAVGASGVALAVLAATPGLAADSTTLARWEMDEVAGPVMHDSSGNGIDGTIGSAVAVTGLGHYHWSPSSRTSPRRSPSGSSRSTTHG